MMGTSFNTLDEIRKGMQVMTVFLCDPVKRDRIEKEK